MEVHPRHQCLVYEGSPSRILPALARVVRQKLAENYRCLYLNSGPMVTAMRFHLTVAGADVAYEVDRTSLVLSSAQTHLVDGRFDVDHMIRTLEEAVDQSLNDGYSGLWASGDMTWEFGPQKDFARLVEYEWRLEEFFRRQPALCGICQYHQDSLPLKVVREGLLAHRSAFIGGRPSRINPRYVWTEPRSPSKPTDTPKLKELAARV
jgi:hypothetical protein